MSQPALPETVDSSALRYPGEASLLRKTCLALAVIYVVFIGLTLSLFALWLLVAYLTVTVLRSRYLAEALEIGEHQLPRVGQLVRECAAYLDIPAPRVFVTVDPGNWPIYTIPVPEPTILMHAHWVRMLDDEELAFYIFHELAHAKLGHRMFLGPVNVLENVGPVSWILTTPLEIMRYALRPWLRLADFSADRVAIACIGGRLEVAAAALAKVIAGEELHQEISPEAFIAQARRLGESRLLSLYEIATGRLGSARRLSRLAQFADSKDFAALTAPRPLAQSKGLLRRLLAWPVTRGQAP
ncbi:MAG: M48 family metalloprotease [Candidatus Wallbacteria bacterium]|nr:M48 family metalloprotease [Candidatus Wallbacteria bacterium]